MQTAITACPRCGLAFSDGELFCPRDGARLFSEASAGVDPLIGQLLSERYHVLRRIGEGGMGRVYEAQHVALDKPVALKVLRDDFSERPEVVARFHQEARSASRIGHPNIVDVTDFGVTPRAAHYFVMELLEGRDLAEELEREGTLGTRRALHIVQQCADALAAAHEKGIIHRDVKPENLFLIRPDRGEDFVKLVDFGIAKFVDETAGAVGPSPRKLTQTGVVFGTPEYMAPELAQGEPADARVDAYALGVILYELLTGRPPFVGDSFMGILAQHARDPVPPLKQVNPACFAPPELERMLGRMLAKSPRERHPSMAALARDVAAVLASLRAEPSELTPRGTVTHGPRALREVRPPSLHAPSGLTRARSRPPSALLRAGLCVLIAAGGAGLWVRARGGATQVAGRRDAVTLPEAPPLPPPAVASAPATPPPADVLIEISTQPAGARVEVAGREVCASTPCRFPAPRGAPLELGARKPGFRPSRMALTPEGEAERVRLVLQRRGPAPRGHHMQGDLMLPDAFGKP